MRTLLLASLVALVAVTHAPAQSANKGVTLAPFAKPLPTDVMGPFARLKDGGIITVDRTNALISRDDGKTWGKPIPMFPKGGVTISNERAVFVTKAGTVVVAFMNLATRSKEYWLPKEQDFPADIHLDVMAVRSTDGGKTWEEPQVIQTGYCGAIRGMVQAADGTLVLPAQNVVRGPARHVATALYSPDDGKTWKLATWTTDRGPGQPHFDIGGHGHHDGAIEATVETLKDGRVWMLIRTGHDFFWEAFSKDNGRTWGDVKKTTIDASSAPALLKRLASGRLLLVWNRLYPEGKTTYDRKGPPWHVKPSCYHREELSAALSDDDGKTWSKPVILGKRGPGQWLSYPYLLEAAPGDVWVTTMQGGGRFHVREADLLAK